MLRDRVVGCDIEVLKSATSAKIRSQPAESAGQSDCHRHQQRQHLRSERDNRKCLPMLYEVSRGHDVDAGADEVFHRIANAVKSTVDYPRSRSFSWMNGQDSAAQDDGSRRRAGAGETRVCRGRGLVRFRGNNERPVRSGNVLADPRHIRFIRNAIGTLRSAEERKGKGHRCRRSGGTQRELLHGIPRTHADVAGSTNCRHSSTRTALRQGVRNEAPHGSRNEERLRVRSSGSSCLKKSLQ